MKVYITCIYGFDMHLHKPKIFLHHPFTLDVKAGIILYFVIVNKAHEKTKIREYFLSSLPVTHAEDINL